jgi:response regulator of citrate/malate metabolism
LKETTKPSTSKQARQQLTESRQRPYKADSLEQRQQKRIGKMVNKNIQQEVKVRTENAPLSIGFDNPRWSKITSMYRDGANVQQFALESALNEVNKFACIFSKNI